MTSKRKRSDLMQRMTVDRALSSSRNGWAKDLLRQDEISTLGPPSTVRDEGAQYLQMPDAPGICFLEYGMVVSLMANDKSGVMASEGFTACEVRLERILPTAFSDDSKQECQLVACHFKDCLFEVLPKMSYDATLTYEKASEYAKLNKSDSSQGFSNPLSEMRFKSESEKRVNATAYSKSHGKHVNYGQVIQLRHIKSGKFLSTKPASNETTDSFDICLSEGSSASHFVLLPRFKLRRKGEPVQLQDQIVIATDDTRLFLQTSNRIDNATSSPLLTASVSHSMQWRFLSFDTSDPVNSTAQTYRQDTNGGLKAGQCLRLFHLETGSWLGFDSTINSLRLDGNDSNENNHHLLSPDTLWEIERICIYEGGPIHWLRHVCIRHVTSGKYLAITSQDIARHSHLKVIADRKPQAFHFRPMTHVNMRAAIPPDSVVQIQHVESNTCLHAGIATDVSDDTNGGTFSREVEAVLASNDEDTFKLVSVPQTEIDDVLLLSSYRRMLKRFVRFFESKQTRQAAASLETFLSEVLDALEAMKAFAFQDNSSDHRRQLLLRKHQYIELVTRILEVPFESWGGPYSMGYVASFREDSRTIYDPMKSNISITLDGLDDGEDEQTAQPTMPSSNPLSETGMKLLYKIIRAANVLLFRMFSNCKQSDAVSCGRSLGVLMKMLGHGFKASFPLSYLIQEKFHLTGEFKSFSRIIRDFLDLIKTQGKSIRYLQFLVVLCSANGLAVSKVQEKICDLLFIPTEGYRDDILIRTRPTQENELEVCIPTRRGDEWKSLKKFYDEYYKQNQYTSLAPYFYGLLQLYVALCADRNYKCIEILKDKFPRNCLLACVQDSDLARSIRAVLMNLLMVIHIDCDPQRPIACPNYTRNWKDTTIHIPQVDTSKYCKEDNDFFSNIKTLVLNYIEKRNGVIVVGVGELARNELTLAMMRTCHKLVEFGMFNSELTTLVGHLVDLLDCRTDSVDVKANSNEQIEYAVPFFENSVQRNKNPFARQYSEDKTARELRARPMKRFSIAGGTFPKPLVQNQVQDTMDVRFRISEGNTIVMEIKDCICATLLRLDGLRLDYQLSLTLMYIKERNLSSNITMSDKVSPLVQALAQRKSNLSCELSLHRLAKRRLDTTLLQTLMYEHPPLVSKALELLYLQFNQHEQLIKALDQVFLLVNDTTVHLYAKLQDDVDRLRHLAETTEVWMDFTSSGDFDMAFRACALFKSLKALMQNKEGTEITRLISNLDVVQYVIAMIYSGSHFFHDLFPSKSVGPSSPQKMTSNSGTLVNDVLREQQRNAIRTVYDHCMEFLFDYCNVNVLIVAQYTLTIIDFAEELPSAQAVLFSIYTNPQCDPVPNEILFQFVRWGLYYKHDREVRYLQFLCGVATSQHVRHVLLMQIVKNPQLVETQGTDDPIYISHELNLLSTIATTGQARDICSESFVSMSRLIEILETFDITPALNCAEPQQNVQPTLFSPKTLGKEASLTLGFACLKYLKDVLLRQEDCVYKMDEAQHIRLFACLRQFTLSCMRQHLASLQQMDFRGESSEEDMSLDRILKSLVPTLLAYFPKFNNKLIPDDATLKEWWSGWYIWLFSCITVRKDSEFVHDLQACVCWIDYSWKQEEKLEDLLIDSLRRSKRPSLGVGLAGMRGNEPFVLDFEKPFLEILGDVKAYRAYCSKQIVPSVADLAAIEQPIPRDEVPDGLPQLRSNTRAKSVWLPSWLSRKQKKPKSSSVMPSQRLSPRRSTYNMPKFGEYADDDSAMVHDFLKYVKDHKQTKSAIRNEMSDMMRSILFLEDSLKEEMVAYAGKRPVISTFDDVAAKLVSHFKMLKQAKYVKMSLVLLDVFSRTILSLDNVDKRRAMQTKLNSMGLTEIIIDLVAQSDDFQVFDRCIWLGIAMLDGMNSTVQEHFHKYLVQPQATDFFLKFKLRFDMLTNQSETRKSMHMMYFTPKARDQSEPANKYQSATRQFRFLQLLCEGHYLLNQKCMLGFDGSKVNLVEIATMVVLELHANSSWDCMALLKQVFDTITEFCQGPCTEAQNCAAHYRFISAVNEILWRDTKALTVTALDLLRQLKAATVITLLSLLERRSDRDIHRRLVQELNLDALKANLIVVYGYFNETYDGKYDGNEACSQDSYLTMGFNIYILMQQLGEFQPSLARTFYPDQDRSKDHTYREAFGFFANRCAHVEIVWPAQPNNGVSDKNSTNDLFTIYFPLHPICICLTDRAKRRLKYDVSREANKLNDFYERTRLVISDMQHQCALRAHTWMALLTLHLSRLKMFAFVWNILLNGLIVLLNQLDATSPPYVVLVAGYIEVLFCLAILTGHCINDVPRLLLNHPRAVLPDHASPRRLHKQSHTEMPFDVSDVKETLQDIEEKLRHVGHGRLSMRQYSFWYILRVVAVDAKTMGYVALLALAVIGVVFDQPLWFSFHLLDIVNRSTELRNVSKAIVHPGRSLIHILLLYILVAYIYGIVGFTYFQQYYVKSSDNSPTQTYDGCSTMWLCFLTSLDEGLKNNGGIGGYLTPSRRDSDPLAYFRLVFDLSYYVSLILVLTNLAFGLIIDTFATLRTQHKEKEDDWKDRCFICSIDGYTFNRMTKRGFKYHTKHEHNVWQYIYLFVHIEHKPFTEYNGVEVYLATKMANHDVSFLPNHRALTLERAATLEGQETSQPSLVDSELEIMMRQVLQQQRDILDAIHVTHPSTNSSSTAAGSPTSSF
ncbi:hypothetical protein AeMF1_019067 [Aphanomyces euteiches]|nr:hypothetical protein AeMF1_019067 [Aphanomyces euteiches]KAH9196991.1 hypothetical protein AeNC1_001022 [Aphanomyces euteiches]